MKMLPQIELRRALRIRQDWARFRAKAPAWLAVLCKGRISLCWLQKETSLGVVNKEHGEQSVAKQNREEEKQKTTTTTT